MIWFYRLLFPLLFIIGLPYYLVRMFRRGGYREMMPSRFGRVEAIPKRVGVKRIWLQAVSVGELLAIESLVKELMAIPTVELVITTTTSTGYSLAKKKYGESALLISSFPIDCWFFVRRTWKRLDPDLAIITEGELWPEHICTAKTLGIPLLLINARLSDKSYRRMTAAKWLQSILYANIERIGASSELDGRRILNLGYAADRMTVVGNLKFDVIDPDGMSAETKFRLCEEIGFSTFEAEGRGGTLIGASTWPGEEAMLIDACVALADRGVDIRLILVPRHAERRSEIRELLTRYSNLRWQFRSRPDWVQKGSADTNLSVYVADTTGELRNFIQIADIAVIGKSFPPHGQGQTPVEAVALGIPVVYGPSMSNFRAICADLEQNGGSLRVCEPDQLVNELFELFNNKERRDEMTKAARVVFERSRGSTQRTLELIQSYF